MDWETPKRRLLRIAGKNELPDQPPTDVPQKGAAELPKPGLPKKDAAPAPAVKGMPVPPPRATGGAQAIGEKKGFFEKLFGGAEKSRKPEPAEPPRGGPVDEEVEELFEQMQGGGEDEQAGAGAKQGGKRRGKKGKEKAGEGKPDAGKKAEPKPEPLPVPTEGMTYRERRKLERMRAQRQAEGQAGGSAQPEEPGAGPPGTGAQPSPAEARQTRRQQRLAQRQAQDEQQAAQPRGGAAPVQAAQPVSSELSGLDVGDLMGAGKKKKKKAAADELEELDEAGLGGDEELSEEELGGEEEGLEDDLEEEGAPGKGEELLTRKCQHCKRQARDTAFCPACGAAMCDQCAPERAKLLDQVKWTCRQCKAQFKVKAKKGAGDEF